VISEGKTTAEAAGPTIMQIYAKLPAQDVGRARRFYAEKLGIEPYGERHNHLYYGLGGAYFMIFPSAGQPAGTHDQLGLVVEDLEAEVTRLRDRGLEFESYPAPPGATVNDGITDMGLVKAAWFRDSEGNLISVAEFPAGSPFQPRP
jgi:catechol 2,3-dioxygenase-like lactoylglutathione lyase family enzyme